MSIEAYQLFWIMWAKANMRVYISGNWNRNMISNFESKIRGMFVSYIYMPMLRMLLNIYGVKMGSDCKIVGRPVISRHRNSQILIGSRSVLVSMTMQTALGVSRPIILRTMFENSKITIGDDSGFSGTTICSAISVEIGDRCLIGADVLIADTDFHQVEVLNRRYLPLPIPKISDGILIGDDVFIGARSIILKGVTIGNGSVIGAGSVVTSDIPPGVVAAGNPAKVLREIESQLVPKTAD